MLYPGKQTALAVWLSSVGYGIKAVTIVIKWFSMYVYVCGDADLLAARGF
jgi:hypothetical protein